MKLLYITNGYKPHRWAGTETYTAGIAEGMVQRGYTVEVLCGGNWDKGAQYWNGVTSDFQNNIPVRRINLNWTKAPDPFGYLYNNPVVSEYLLDLLRIIKPNVVHVTSCETLSASVLRTVKAANIPLVLSLTDFWFLCPRINLLHAAGTNCSGQTSPVDCLDCKMMDNRTYRQFKKIVTHKLTYPILEEAGRHTWLTRQRGLRGLAGDMKERKAALKQALTLPDCVITASNFVKEIFVENGVTRPIVVQPYGHDLSWLKTDMGKSNSDKIRFGYVGQIIEAKGVHLILQALSELPSELVNACSLVIYGNLEHTPAYGQRLRELAARLPNISFAGTYQHFESARVFEGIDVLLVPSIWYDFPLIIHEAFATGTPVIATNLGGMAEVVSHENNGLLFERGNVQDLASQLTRLIREPDLFGKLKQNLPAVKSTQEEVSELEMIYQQIRN
jgi:glycosyltransferase involved in cell wall biosynthesis